MIDTSNGNFTYGTAITKANMALTKISANTLTVNSPTSSTFTGGLNVNGGTLVMDFANMATPVDMVNNANVLALGGGILSVKGNSGTDTSQTFNNVTINAGAGQILVNPNGASRTATVNLGALTANTGSSLLVGKASGASGTAVITTTSVGDGTGIYGGRVVYTDGNGNYDWATTISGGSPYTLSAYNSYETNADNWNYNPSGTANVIIADGIINGVIGGIYTTIGGPYTTMNSLKLTGSSSYTVTNDATALVTLTSGGLLISRVGCTHPFQWDADDRWWRLDRATVQQQCGDSQHGHHPAPAGWSRPVRHAVPYPAELLHRRHLHQRGDPGHQCR